LKGLCEKKRKKLTVAGASIGLEQHRRGGTQLLCPMNQPAYTMSLACPAAAHASFFRGRSTKPDSAASGGVLNASADAPQVGIVGG